MAKVKYKKLYLKYQFNEKEHGELAMTMAEKSQELKQIEQNAKAAASQFKSEKEGAQGELDSAARKYKDGYEMRDIECEEVADFENGVVRLFRTDNGEMAQERRMSNEERQMCLDEIETAEKANGLDAGDDKSTHVQYSGPGDDDHIAGVNRIMSQERAVPM